MGARYVSGWPLAHYPPLPEKGGWGGGGGQASSSTLAPPRAPPQDGCVEGWEEVGGGDKRSCLVEKRGGRGAFWGGGECLGFFGRRCSRQASKKPHAHKKAHIPPPPKKVIAFPKPLALLSFLLFTSPQYNAVCRHTPFRAAPRGRASEGFADAPWAKAHPPAPDHPARPTAAARGH